MGAPQYAPMDRLGDGDDRVEGGRAADRRGAAGAGARDAAETAAFERVFRAHASAFYEYAGRIVRSPEVAREVVHDAFVAAWRSPRARESEGALRAYVFVAVRTAALMHIRHLAVEARYAGEAVAVLHAGGEVAPPADEVVHRQDTQGAVRHAIDALPDRTRTVLILSRFTNLTYREIAEMLGISVKTVEWHLTRAFTLLRVKLAVRWPLGVVGFAVLTAGARPII